MKIISSAFENNSLMPSKYTCEGPEVNPPLEFKDVPEDSKSLVLIVDDPDAPVKTFIHWTIWNIDPKITEIGENSSPKGAIEGITSSGKRGYDGPCPPSGTHRYFFKLFAIDKMLDLSPSSYVGDIESAIEGHVIRKAELIGLYKKKYG
ncbi:MAG: YbhB/YbcL family Raf kinase inhibitor-like protein [Actinobacteria bacterium]|nr:YbhB/YbcL family Raf kinase inhibitor-like protein [Actinomycetota bacterium]MCL5070125.1 YbhB/YbcL family Raf kinase inhibitor-like protein [Actinomycetota bacterium]